VLLTLTDVRRLAVDAAREQHPPLQVVGVASAGGGSAYAEVILMVRGCRVEPCRVIVGVSRNASEAECREAIQARLQQHLDEHRAADTTHA
jgi:hypothetical protein